jgi:hypothetical protein
VDGNVTAGVGKWHQAPLGKNDPEYYLTIESFTPTTFSEVTEVTRRDVTFTIEVPSGFTNTGSTIDCIESIKQPPAPVAVIDSFPNHINEWHIGVRAADNYNNFVEKIYYIVYIKFLLRIFKLQTEVNGRERN